MKSYCFIINCASNADKAEKLFREHQGYIQSKFPGSENIFVKPQVSIKEVAAKAAQKYSVVVACGGDGTVNKVANGILDANVALGVLPMGSGNDFAKSMGLSRDFRKNLDILHRQQTTDIDVINTGSEIFLNTWGMGLDGLTNYYASKLPLKRGSLRYFFGGLAALAACRPFKVSYKLHENWQEKSVWMVVIANGKTEGGKYLISPASLNTDGIFEVVLVNKIMRLQLLKEFIKLSLGIPFSPQVVTSLAGTRLSLKNPGNLKIHADGERVPETEEFTFSIRKKALTVIADLEKI